MARSPGRSSTACWILRSQASSSSTPPSGAPSAFSSGSAVPSRVLLATRSDGKLRELRPMFAERRIDVIDLTEAGIPESAAEDALEIYESFEENALAKGRYFAALSGMPVAADDSGIEVRALGGRPGVRSKRWSERPDLAGQSLDDENNRLLASLLSSHADRRARYVCAAAFVNGAREIV